MDVGIVVDSDTHFTHSVFPKIMAHFPSLGYRVHPLPARPAESAGVSAGMGGGASSGTILRGCKLVPQVAQCTEQQLFKELMARRREQAHATGEALSRADCGSGVSKMIRNASAARKRRWMSEAIGVVSLDIELCVISNNQLFFEGYPGVVGFTKWRLSHISCGIRHMQGPRAKRCGWVPPGILPQRGFQQPPV